jgi:tRNA threonylcarbamoyladenosine biosynthesis protein TsaB
MNILAIDTSTNRGSVALLRAGELVFTEDFSADRSHSATLFATLARAKEAAAPGAFEQIVIGLGPGSYAGIRIAIAAAIGLELATGAQLIGIPSVAAWETHTAHYLAIGDARRETFYWTRVEEGVCAEGPLLLSADDLRSRLESASLPVFASEAIPGIEKLEIALPSAAILARLSAENRGIVATGALEPIYLREPHITQPKATQPSRPPN